MVNDTLKDWMLQQLDAGISQATLTGMVTDTLAAATTAKEIEETERTNWLTELKNTLLAHLNTDQLNRADASAMATLVYANEYPLATFNKLQAKRQEYHHLLYKEYVE